MYKSSSSSNKAGDRKQPAIFCDMCAEEDRRAAAKTCMKCEISMCVEHLQPHLTKQVFLLSHPLTEPMAPGAEGLGGTKCPQHGKLLEYYCLDDLTSVCVSCAIEDQHRLHNMKTFPKAQAELVEKIAEGERAVAAKRQESEELGKWEQSKREEVSQYSLRLIDAVSKLRDMTLNRVQSSVSARMGCIATGGSSIQAAMGEKDTFRFLQLYSQVNQDMERAKAVDLRKGLETGQERDKLSQELQEVGAEMMDQATKLCGSVLMFVDPENQRETPGNANAIFEPRTLVHGMSLSADHRKAFYSQAQQSGTNNQCTLRIKDANSTSPLHSWKIAVSEYYDWTIGFWEHESTLDQGIVYALCIKDDLLSYLKNNPLDNPFGAIGIPHHIPGVVRPKTVEVCWNPQDFSLSFFTCSSRHYQRRLIVSIDVRNSSSGLKPFVKLQSKAGLQQPQLQQINSVGLRQMWGQQNIGYHNNSFNVTSLLCELL
ncbi:zinc finger protein RFP [Gadus macrocephalus]|uniref:zinc finger protein RFP n=1 Tax=Gadus macrocephalus TaxID=80720 RepID=UPI0028CB2D70|nr:zinc finger protein RFP [Gadus macrocephalus]